MKGTQLATRGRIGVNAVTQATNGFIYAGFSYTALALAAYVYLNADARNADLTADARSITALVDNRRADLSTH